MPRVKLVMESATFYNHDEAKEKEALVMKRNVCFLALFFLVFCIAANRVMSDDEEQKNKLEGRWEGELCIGPLPESVRKYMCEKVSLQFTQIGEQFGANGLFTGHLSLALEGVSRGNVFYGTYRYSVTSSDREYGSVRGVILQDDTLQMTMDYFQIKDDAKTWMHGGIATLKKMKF